MTQPIPVAVLGATGYAGETAIRILLDHPGFQVVHAGSDRLAGTALGDAVPTFTGTTDLVLAPDAPEAIAASGAKAILLCKKSPDVTQVVPALLDQGLKVVDVGPEFRLRDIASYDRWYAGPHDCPDLLAEAVYGLTELNTEAITSARVVGNPGCYATSMLLPLVPLLRAGLIDLGAPLVSVGYSGVSGAGKRFLEGNNNLFYALNENLHSYKALAHQHQAEVDQELSLAAGKAVHLHFIPHLAPITRGILSTISGRLAPGTDADAVNACWDQAFAGRPFARRRDDTKAVEVANVNGSNACDFAISTDGDVFAITSAVDNLVKGASGQAVQNLNLMCGYDETAGLLNRSL